MKEGVMADVASSESKVSARERSLWILRNSRILLLALVLLVIAGILVSVSFAAFTSSSANAGNMFTAGSLSQANSDNGAILTADGMVPGDVVEGSVTVENTGESDGAFALSSSNPTDTAGPNDGELSTVLQLEIVEGSDVIYSGDFDAMTPVDLGTWDGGEAHTFDFTVTFPDGGEPESPTTGDNAYQGSSTSVTYTWDATSST
jgi:hypothetical protein